MKDKLYLLKPGFMDQGQGPYFCPGCALVEGMLSFYPVLRDKVEIIYLDFPRPRTALIAEIGEENQGCPKLVLAAPPRTVPEEVTIHHAQGRSFVTDGLEIARYLAAAHGVAKPH